VTWSTIELELRFANPRHHPDWVADDRPAWTLHNEALQKAFGAWILRQLDELECHVRAEREAEMEPMLSEFIPAPSKRFKAAAHRLQQMLADIRLMKPRATVNEIVDRERLGEIRRVSGWKGGAGRPASGSDWARPTAKAARDLWRIRKIILPRFWAQAGKGGKGPTNEALAAIVAPRYPPATASETLNCYKNERLASR